MVKDMMWYLYSIRLAKKVFQICGGSGGLNNKFFFHLTAFSSESNERSNPELYD